MTSMKTRLCAILNIEAPIIQAPIGGAATPKFISAVANYGALGVLALGTRPLNECMQTIQQTQALTNRPLAANLILEWDQSERVALCLEQGIKVIWFFWGDPSPYIEQIHAQGGKVMLTVGSAAQATQAVAAGVDIIVAQGWEAGGHVWGQVATMPLIPAVVDAVGNTVPVVAAGGIADGRGLAASLMLGATGVVMGTRLLVSCEAHAHAAYKQRIIESCETDTVYTSLFDKHWADAPARVLENSTYQQWVAAGKPAVGARPGEQDVITQYHGTPVERYSIYIPSPEMPGDTEPMAHYAGQGSALIHCEQPVSDIFDMILHQARQCIQSLQV